MPVRASVVTVVTGSIALVSCSPPDRARDSAGATPSIPAGAAVDTVTVAAAPIAAPRRAAPRRADPLADPRLHAHQGGPLCDRTDRRDLSPYRDSVPWLAKEDLSVGPEFLCRLRAGRPRVRLKVASAKPPGGWVDSVLVYSPSSATRPRQVLRPEEGSAPYLGSDFLQGVDLNRDGWMDVKVGRFWGVTGNEMVDVFMYHPARGRFVRDTILSGGGPMDPVAGRACVNSRWVFGHAGMLYSNAEYCWIGRRWVLSRSEEQVDDRTLSTRDTFVYLRTTKRRRMDGSYTTRVETVGPQGRRRRMEGKDSARRGAFQPDSG